MRLNITVKLMLFASLLLAIPFIGYHYIWDMEKYLRKGQEQTLKNNAKALATALHERPALFNNHASYKDTLEQGKDFFPTQITQAIQLDGLNNDWQLFHNKQTINDYGADNQIGKAVTAEHLSIAFTAQIGRFNDYVYAFFDIKDDKVIFRGKNIMSVTNNDHLEIATIDGTGELHRYVISNHQPGWVSAFKIDSTALGKFPSNAKGIQGQWRVTATGYSIELRIKQDLLGEKVGFNITDIDVFNDSSEKVVIGTADTQDSQDLGTFTVPSEQIERIIKAMGRSHSKIWVVDKHQRVLTDNGDIHTASGDWSSNEFYNDQGSWFSNIRQWVIAPFYQYFLTKPPNDFSIEQFSNRQHKKRHVKEAINDGKLASIWWTTKDNKAVILSAAHPIYVDNNIMGAVVVEETTHGIRSIRNKAVEGVLLTSIFIYISVAGLFLYTLYLSFRIRKLRNQTESVVDENGRIMASLPVSNVNDELGDLSKSFTNIIAQLSQYNDYLQNMSSRLSHELKTPVAVVRSSLEHLSNQNNDNNNGIYIERAQQGILRLDSMLQAMSEATRLEQSLVTSDKQQFDLAKLVQGCSMSYQQIYPLHSFNLCIYDQPLFIDGNDELIAQLFDKIINNAVEFSDEKQPITIELKQHHQHAQLTIINKGIRLPDKMTNSIFDAMVSVRTEDQMQQPHLGIGLYICKLISDFHQGQIQAHNLTDNSGVKFTLTLPLQSGD